jgi:hypothetical protein
MCLLVTSCTCAARVSWSTSDIRGSRIAVDAIAADDVDKWLDQIIVDTTYMLPQ